MAINEKGYAELKANLDARGVTLVAVSKTKPVTDIAALYRLGQRDFAENYVQELVEKQPQLPADIRWHFIGHLQRNKVKYIVPFCSLIQGVDSPALLQEINKQAQKLGRVVDCLLQVHISNEETKFGMDPDTLLSLLRQRSDYPFVRVAGVMGMASFTEDPATVKKEFSLLRSLFDRANYEMPEAPLTVVSMGMSGDYEMAIAAGSTMVRVGSLLFGVRQRS